MVYCYWLQWQICSPPIEVLLFGVGSLHLSAAECCPGLPWNTETTAEDSCERPKDYAPLSKYHIPTSHAIVLHQSVMDPVRSSTVSVTTVNSHPEADVREQSLLAKVSDRSMCGHGDSTLRSTLTRRVWDPEYTFLPYKTGLGPRVGSGGLVTSYEHLQSNSVYTPLVFWLPTL